MEEKIEKVIRNHVIFSMTSAAIPVPFADIAAVTAIQIDMIKQLASHYSVNWNENSGKTFVSALAGASMARMAASFLKSIPGAGTLFGIGAQVIMSGASTYALGHIFERHFSKGGNLSDFNTEAVKKAYNDLVGKGKDVVKNIRRELKRDDVMETIEKLNSLKQNGVITEKEFDETKKRLLDRIGE
jgi:uncharacterized protein (DUF697 family)